MLEHSLRASTRGVLFALLSLALLPGTARAVPPVQDTNAPGFQPGGAQPVGVFDACATLPGGDRVVFDGQVMRLVAPDGTTIRVLGQTSGPVYPSFVLPDPTSTFALIGESSRGRIYRADLGGAGAPVIAHVDYNFDAVFEDAGHVLLSAAVCSFGCGNDILRLDLATGTTTVVASVIGPSGPLALDANGDLFYGSIPNAFPPPPTSILHWTHAQVASGVVLDESVATTFVSGIVPPSSLRFDPVYGHLFVAEPTFGGTSEVREYDKNGAQVSSVAQSADYLSGIELVRTQGPGSCQAFQPDGVELVYRGTDYNAGTSELRALATRRPTSSMTGPGLSGPGAVTFHVRNAFPNASMLVLVGLRSTYDPNEHTYDTGTYLLHTGLDLAHTRRLVIVPTDASGTGTFTFQNPGNLQGTRVFQALVRDTSGAYVGSSTAAFN
jgi:hypothetical protein